jgi:hypothetical protein
MSVSIRTKLGFLDKYPSFSACAPPSVATSFVLYNKSMSIQVTQPTVDSPKTSLVNAAHLHRGEKTLLGGKVEPSVCPCAA